MVKTSPSNAGDTSSIPGWGAHIPPASEPRGQGVEQAYSGSSIVANSIVFFFNGSQKKESLKIYTSKKKTKNKISNNIIKFVEKLVQNSK